MNQKEIGVFIAEKRKAKSLTQKELAEKLSVTYQAVSKWECGKGMPDISLMQPLCNLLDITVNELLFGENIAKEEQIPKAESQIINLLHKQEENKKTVWLSTLTGMAGVFVVMSAVLLVIEYSTVQVAIDILIIISSLAVIAVLLIVLIINFWETGIYKCSKCNKDVIPNGKGLQIRKSRRLKCSYCNKKNWCKRKTEKIYNLTESSTKS